MASKSIVYGVIVLLIALLIISSTFAFYYFTSYNQEKGIEQKYLNELKAVNSQYNELASNYNELLSQYNRSLSLLVNAISVMNTTESSYKEASTELSSLWNTLLRLRPASLSLIRASVLFDFGNGTRRWYNETQIEPGWNLYIATVIMMNGNVNAQWYPQFGSHFVTGIAGVTNTKTNFWYIWAYNKTTSWQLAQVGADQLKMYNGSIYAWTFCAADQNYNPLCKP